MDNPYDWLQNVIEQVPAILRPLIVAVAAAVPYIEGEGAAAFGILAGLHPVVAAVAAATGNIACVVGVVLLGARVRERVVARRADRTDAARTGGPAVAAPDGRSGGGTPTGAAGLVTSAVGVREQDGDTVAKGTRRAKGHARLRRWVVRFGVPGASLLGPVALPTMLTAAFLAGTGVPKQRVIFWQVVASVLWTSGVALAATGALALLGW